MITLKSLVSAAPVVTALRLETADCAAVFTVDVERDDKKQPKPQGSFQGDGENRKWVEDKGLLKQIVQWPGGSFEAIVPEKEAVGLDGRVGRVVVEVEIDEVTLPTYEAGKKSKTAQTIRLRRVIGVWGDNGKPLWEAGK